MLQRGGRRIHVCEEEEDVSLDLLQRVSLDLHQIKVGLLTCIHAHNLSLSLSLSLTSFSVRVSL
jgi:hypothetical protein